MSGRLELGVVLVVGALVCAGCTKKKAPEAKKPQPTAVEAASPKSASEAPRSLEYKVLPSVPAAGTLSGTVRFQGAPPPNKPVVMNTAFRNARPDDFEYCDSKNVKEDKLQVLGGGVANALIEIKGLAAGKGFSQPTAVYAENCRLSPRLTLLPKGSPVTVSNRGPFPYSVTLVGAEGEKVWSRDLEADSKASSSLLGKARTPESDPGLRFRCHRRRPPLYLRQHY